MENEFREPEDDYRSPLQAEHHYLGYQGTGCPRVYTSLADELEIARTSPSVCDSSQTGKIRIAGPSSERFVATMTTCDLEHIQDVGAARDALVLNSLGEIIDKIDVIRTGENEFMVLTYPENSDEVFTWFQAHSELTYEGNLVFEDISLEDETTGLAGICLSGLGAGAILNDLSIPGDLSADRCETVSVPPHMLDYLVLDTVPTLVFRSDASAEETYELYCQNASAPLLWRALLSFPEIVVIGTDTLESLKLCKGSLFCGAGLARYVDPIAAGLMSYVRAGGGFVGEKALASKLHCQEPMDVLRVLSFAGLDDPDRITQGMEVFSAEDGTLAEESCGIIANVSFSLEQRCVIAVAYIQDAALKNVTLQNVPPQNVARQNTRVFGVKHGAEILFSSGIDESFMTVCK